MNQDMHGWEWAAVLGAVCLLAVAGAFLLAPLIAGPTFDKVWPEVVKGLPAAFVALVIGLIAAGIAYRQMKIADHQRRVAADKLSFDLFKERYEVFLVTMKALSAAVEWIGHGTSQDAFNEVKRNRPRAQFLFGEEVAAYIEEVVKHFSWLITIREATRQNGGIVPFDLLEQLRTSQTWILDAAQAGAQAKFSTYLDFSHWRPGDDQRRGDVAA